MDAQSLSRQKALLRAELLRRRSMVPAAAARAAADAVAENLPRASALPAGAAVSGYWPLPGELDPRPLMLRLHAAGHGLALPRMQDREEPLAFHAWRPGDTLIPGRFRVMEPMPERRHLLPAVMLVPLVAFDRSGRRLGHGKGYYDRTIASLRQTNDGLLAIGLAFACQEVEDVPAGPADQRLDAVVTEQDVLICSDRLPQMRLEA